MSCKRPIYHPQASLFPSNLLSSDSSICQYHQILVQLKNMNNKSWSLQDHMELVIAYQKHIDDPSKYRYEKISLHNKSNTAASRHIEAVRLHANQYTKSFFSERNAQWSNEETNDMLQQIEVRNQVTLRGGVKPSLNLTLRLTML